MHSIQIDDLVPGHDVTAASRNCLPIQGGRALMCAGDMLNRQSPTHVIATRDRNCGGDQEFVRSNGMENEVSWSPHFRDTPFGLQNNYAYGMAPDPELEGNRINSYENIVEI